MTSSLPDDLTIFRIPLEDIVTATENFADENLLKRGKHTSVYKGLLLRQSEVWINVVVRRVNNDHHDISEFRLQIERLAGYVHRYKVCFIGYCDDKDEQIIVTEHVINGNLDSYLTDSIILKWSQRLHICFGVALAFTYIRNAFKSFKIFLDENFEAKVLIIPSKNYRENKNSDALFFLGVLLLEVVYGRKLATIKDVYQYKNQLLDDDDDDDDDDVDDDVDVDDDDIRIDQNLRKQMNQKSLSIFKEIVNDCFNDRQNTYLSEIVETLNNAFKIQWKHENHLRLEKFAYLKIPLRRVMLATNNFADSYRINTNDDVYKTELITHFDKECGLTIEDDNNCHHESKKPVIIQRMNKFENTTKDLFAEIEMLISRKRHMNVLSFLGYCDEDSEMVLVFECAFKETLDDHLRNTSNYNLSWEKRIRICLDVAHGLKYLHSIDAKPNQVIQSVNVFLDENLTAKITNFNLFSINPFPIFLLHRKRHVNDDIYFLGVILFEILSGRFADSVFYMMKNVEGVSSMTKLKNMADPMIKEEAQHSLDTFSEITFQCLRETPSERPQLEVVIISLEKALKIQVKRLEHLKIPLKDIKSTTKNFDINCRIGSGAYGEVYKTELKMKSKDEHDDMSNNIVAIKRITNRKNSEGIEGFFVELDVVSKCKHPNIVSLVGFCVEDGEMLLVYELASNGSLDDYLERIDMMMINFTWTQRLKLCLDIAQGLNYMHTTMEDKERIIHRDIKSANILLSNKFEAKIADFGLSKVHTGSQHQSTINTDHIAGTSVYLDPEYARTGRLKKASDIYSFGVVLFEIFSGKLAYHVTYMEENDKGIAPIARRHFENGTLKEILDSNIMDEACELGLTLRVRPDLDSLDRFSKIAYQCLALTQDKRPTIEIVIDQLNEALQFQENRMKTLKLSLEHIKMGVENFADEKCIMRGTHGWLFNGTLEDSNRDKKVVVKRFKGQENGFLKEFEVLFKYKHENIIGLVGYCKEIEEKIIVYEYVSKGSLISYLNDISFSWVKRLKVCIDIAKGLKFLHEGDVGQDVVIHRDIKTSHVLLTYDWKAKICGFEFALTYPTNKKIEYVANDVIVGSPGYYCDPLYWGTHFLTKESDIYSFGVVLIEILCGRLTYPDDVVGDQSLLLDVLVRSENQVTRLKDMVFDGIKEQIVQPSFSIFQEIAFHCLHEKREQRPEADDVVVQLQKALEFQEAYEIRKARLQRTYKEILDQFSEIYSYMRKKDIYNILSKGILLEDDKLLNEDKLLVSKEKIWDFDHSAEFFGEHDDDYHSEPLISPTITRKYFKRRHKRQVPPAVTLKKEMMDSSSSTISDPTLNPEMD